MKDFSVVTMCRVAIIFFELFSCKLLNRKTLHDNFFILKLCLIPPVPYINRIV